MQDLTTSQVHHRRAPCAPLRVAAYVGLWGTLIALACSASFDVEELYEGACEEGFKACNETCVSAKSPSVGCGSPSCSPCALPSATATCDAFGACAIASCMPGTQDCDGDPLNGCEVDIQRDPDFCGGCDVEPCEVDHGTPGCTNGRCTVFSCSIGFRDCNENPADGCETELGTDENCSGCGDACASGTSCIEQRCE